LRFAFLPFAFCLLPSACVRVQAGRLPADIPVDRSMDATLRTPLLDLFRRDEVAVDVRMLAAKGAIAPRALEQLVLLMLLTADRDTDVRTTAEGTIARIPVDLLSGFIARSEVPADLRDFFVARGVPVAATPSATSRRRSSRTTTPITGRRTRPKSRRRR